MPKLKRLIGYLLGGGLIILPLSFAPIVASATTSRSTVAVTSATPTQLYESQLRAQFGFESDIPYVQDVDASSAASLNNELQIPLTAEEASNLLARDATGNSIAGIDSLESGNTTFAGAWMDQAAGGVLDVAFVGGATPPEASAVEALVPTGASVSFPSASVSLQQLTAIQHVFYYGSPQLSAADIKISSSVLQLPEDEVDVYATSPTSDVSAVLTSLFGSAGWALKQPVVTPQLQDARDLPTGPLYGGEWTFTLLGSGYANGCSTGYADSPRQ